MHVGDSGCTRGVTLKKLRCFPEAPAIITLTFPHHSLSHLSALTPAAAISGSENSKATTDLHHRHQQHHPQHFGNGDRDGEQGQGGGAAHGRGGAAHGRRRGAGGAPSGKRRNYGHYHEEAGPTHFCKVILAPKLECIPMPLDFTKHFSAVPMEFKLKTNTGCSWRVTVKLMNGGVTLDQGLGPLRRRPSDQDRVHGDLQVANS